MLLPCHGVLTNRNTVPMRVTVKFDAFLTQTSPDPFASASYFVEDLQAGASHAADASGFLIPCTAIKPRGAAQGSIGRGRRIPAALISNTSRQC